MDHEILVTLELLSYIWPIIFLSLLMIWFDHLIPEVQE